MALLLTILSVLKQIGGKLAKLADADTVREKVLIGFDIAREVSANTATTADDAVVALVDQVGEEKAADLIVAGLALFGIDDTPGPFGSEPPSVASADGERDASLALMADEAGVALPTLITVITTIASLIQYAPMLIDLFRRRKDVGPH